MNRRTILAIVLPLACWNAPLAQQQPPPIEPNGVQGARLVAGGGKLPAAIYDRFLELAGGKDQARIVIVPTASARADSDEGRQQTLQRWQKDHPGYRFEVLHTRDRREADREEFTAPIRSATGVWFGGGAQARLAAAYVGTRVERELHALLERGGIVGGSSAGAAIQTRVMIARGKAPPKLTTGLDLVPLAIVDQHFLKRQRLPRLVQALESATGRFGIGIDEGTAILVRGRTVEVLGNSKALFVLPKTATHAQRIDELTASQSVDLTTWQRAARQRGLGGWPSVQLAKPRVASGALVLGGGGGLPDSVFERFVQLAGGKDQARIVLVPTASPARGRGQSFVERKLRALGVTDVRTLTPAHPSEVAPGDLDKIDRATGIWFGGGRQWRIIDAFDGTEVPAAFQRVLARGGVIGGSSAGATIQGDLLVRGNPRGNRDMWCEGYGRGYGFLPGCAVDQHFMARKRQQDMQELIGQWPQVLGIGIDEGTAAVVTGSKLEVVGKSVVAIFDARHESFPSGPQWLEPGARWDLVAGTSIE